MVLKCNMIINTPFISDWEGIRLRKQKITDKNSQIENKNCKPHIYRLREKVLVRNKKANKCKEPYVVPYSITQVWDNGNVTMRWGALQERINIRWIKPYDE